MYKSFKAGCFDALTNKCNFLFDDDDELRFARHGTGNSKQVHEDSIQDDSSIKG